VVELFKAAPLVCAGLFLGLFLKDFSGRFALLVKKLLFLVQVLFSDIDELFELALDRPEIDLVRLALYKVECGLEFLKRQFKVGFVVGLFALYQVLVDFKPDLGTLGGFFANRLVELGPDVGRTLAQNLAALVV